MDKSGKPYCGNCDKTDGLIYTSAPPKVRCAVTGKYHWLIDRCDCDAPAQDETQDGTSLFCEHIGVAPGQPFIVHGYPYRDYPPMVYGEDGCVRLYSPDSQKRHKVGGRAITWIMDHPESVEPCRGYTPQEVAFKKEAPMEKTDKPRICEVLGVEVGERFELGSTGIVLLVNGDGKIHMALSGGESKETDLNVNYLVDAYNKNRIIRKPRFTEEEVADAKAIRRLHQTAVEVERYLDGSLGVRNTSHCLFNIRSSLFPSLRPGQSIALSDIVDAKKAPT